ncbi:hypothetical protein BH09PLA1_BH09PLA1_26150 [soil metagenome]
MTASIRALLSELIDYAGLFPPAALELEPAIRNYAQYVRGEDRWMLGRFICPASKLSALAPFIDELFPTGEPLRISALGRGGKTREEFDAATRADAEDIRKFAAANPDRADIDVFETRAPAGAKIPLEMLTFVEANLAGNWRNAIGASIESAELRQLGFKLRTGGVEAAAFPPAEQLAFAIAACRDARVPIKFTAGLHHPVRHLNSSVQARMHGFVNVFAASVLAYAHPLDEAKLIPILNDEEAASFRFDNDGLGYKDLRATVDQIESARRHVISFGSCSFDEPRDDLRAVGWL